MVSSSTLPAQAGRVDTRQLPVAALIAGAVSAIANLAIYLLVTFGLGIGLEVQMGGPAAPVEPLGAVPVLLMSALPALVAAGLLWLLNRLVARPFLVFQAIAAVVALLSLGGPLSLQVGLASKIVLSLMHIVAATAIVLVLRQRARLQA